MYVSYYVYRIKDTFSRAFNMRYRWVILLMSITFVAAYDGDSIDDTGCPMSFHGKCSCGNTTYSNWKQGEEVYVVNCTNTRFNSTAMLEMLPNGTQGDLQDLNPTGKKSIKIMKQAKVWTLSVSFENKSSQVSLTGSSRRMCSYKYINMSHACPPLSFFEKTRSKVGVRKHQHKVWLDERIILVYNMTI